MEIYLCRWYLLRFISPELYRSGKGSIYSDITSLSEYCATWRALYDSTCDSCWYCRWMLSVVRRLQQWDRRRRPAHRTVLQVVGCRRVISVCAVTRSCLLACRRWCNTSEFRHWSSRRPSTSQVTGQSCLSSFCFFIAVNLTRPPLPLTSLYCCDWTASIIN